MNDQSLQKRYPDLIDTQTDRASVQLIYDLDSSYTRIKPPPRLTWNALRRQHMERAEEQPRGIITLFHPAHKLSIRTSVVLLVVLALLVIAGTAYAALSPVLLQVLNGEPGTQQLLRDRQYQDLHLPKTLGGFTVTIEKAYADANRVIVGMTIKNPQDRPFDNVHFLYSTLTTQQGQNLSILDASGTSEKGTTGYALSFDASKVQSDTGEIHLTLIEDTLSILKLDSPLPQPANTTPQVYEIKGPLKFYFTVPFRSGRTFTTSKVVTTGGRTITLEKVSVSPSETQVYIQGNTMEQVEELFVFTLSVEGHDYAIRRSALSGSNTLVLSFPYPLLKKHGTWTLTCKYQPHVSFKGGPWVFHFIVP